MRKQEINSGVFGSESFWGDIFYRNANNLFSTHQVFRIALMLILILLLTACSEKSTVDPGGNQNTDIASISISSADSIFVGVGTTLQLTAIAKDDNNRTLADISFQWSSSQPAIASVDTNGLVSSLSPGKFTIIATAENQSGQFAMEVYPISGQGGEAIDRDMIGYMKQGELPGAAFAVVKDGRLVMARGYGYADSSNKIPVEADNLFRIASVTKPITAVTILKLIEDGQLSLDDRAFDILADLVPQNGPTDPQILNITVEQLLRHMGGWDRSIVTDPMHRMREVAIGMGVSSPPSAETTVRWLLTQPLQFTPGERFSYHNLSYLVLGRIIESITGTTYESHVQNNIFVPLGITRARTGKTKLSERADGEVLYYIDATGPSVCDDTPGTVSQAYGGAGGHIPTKDASGGWIMSVIDLARFAIAADGDPATPDILSSTMQDYMLEETGSVAYGAGWILSSTAHFHSGALNGSVSYLQIQNDGTIMVGLVNTSDVNVNIFGLFIDAVNAVQNWPSHDLFAEYD